MAESPTKRLVVTRFSAMGDVVLLLPALQAVLNHHPEAEIVLATRPSFAPFFQGIPRLQVFPADLTGHHRGIRGLWRLFHALRAFHPTHWIDAHDVLRTQFLRSLAWIWSIPVKKIDKDRSGKKQWTRRHNKNQIPLSPTVERYLACFQRAGLGPTHLIPQTPYFVVPAATKNTERTCIGIAPFAQHAGKRWLGYPALIELIVQHTTWDILIFGGGKKEKEQVEQWHFPANRVTNTIGCFSLTEELSRIQSLDLMIANDSSNLHLAGLSGIPTLSIWGATHPDVGFGPWPTQHAHVVQIPTEDLSCRPCAVFGQKVCFRGDYACLTNILPEDVFNQLKTLLP